MHVVAKKALDGALPFPKTPLPCLFVMNLSQMAVIVVAFISTWCGAVCIVFVALE